MTEPNTLPGGSNSRAAAIDRVEQMLPTQTSIGPNFDKRVAAERIVDAVIHELQNPNKYSRAMRRAEARDG